MNGIAMRVAENLDLDMARPVQRPFQDQVRGPEGLLRFRARQRQGRDQLGLAFDPPHPASAAASGGLDHDRITDGPRCVQKSLVRLVAILIAGQAGHAGRDHAPFRDRLVAHHRDRFRRGSDEDQAGIEAGPGEIGILGEEAITGMDGLCTA